MMLASSTQPVITELPGIVIPEDATIASLKTAGGYDYRTKIAEKYITDEEFKVTVRGSRSLHLAELKVVICSGQAEKAVGEMGYKVALVEDLLAVGAHSEYRELQREFSIIALGSSIIAAGSRLIPGLGGWAKRRDLHLFSDTPKTLRYCRFLIVDEGD